MQDNHERIQEKFRRELGEALYGALQNPSVTELMLNEDGTVWLDTFDGMVSYSTLSPLQAHNLIRTVASIAGVEVHVRSPDIAAELRLVMDSQVKTFRFQGLIPPVVSAPVFAIRKPASRVFELGDYVTRGMMTPHQQRHLTGAILARQNILVVGGTGSGKTTLCNALLQEIATRFPRDRTAIIEDTLELQCRVPNKIQLRSCETRSMNDLLRVCMRLRPDRIIIGEVRGKEAHALIKAWNTGHPGGVSTIHANDALRGLWRVAQLVEEAGVRASHEAIAEAINQVVFITRDASHPAGRRVTQLLAVHGYDRRTHQYDTTLVASETVSACA